MSNIKKPASDYATIKKLLLFPGDPLINTLKPDYYIIVDPSTLDAIGDDTPGFDPLGDDPEEDIEVEIDTANGPSLSDITLVSKTMVTDANKNQYVEFVFNIKNSVGDAVVGVNGYGQ